VLSDPEIGRRDAIIVCPGWQQLRAEKSGRWACGGWLPQGGGPRLAAPFFGMRAFFSGRLTRLSRCITNVAPQAPAITFSHGHH